MTSCCPTLKTQATRRAESTNPATPQTAAGHVTRDPVTSQIDGATPYSCLLRLGLPVSNRAAAGTLPERRAV